MNLASILVLPIPRDEQFYLGQVRRRGARVWETVTSRCYTPQIALARALLSKTAADVQARVILVDGADPRSPIALKEF